MSKNLLIQKSMKNVKTFLVSLALVGMSVSGFTAFAQHPPLGGGGGGGQLAMSEYNDRRLKIGEIKAEQIRATGAKVVITPCHNCVDQLSQLNHTCKLGVKIKTIAEIVAEAVVIKKTFV